MDATPCLIRVCCALALLAGVWRCEPGAIAADTLPIAPERVIEFGDPGAFDENPQREVAVVTAVAVSPDGTKLVAGGDDQIVRAFDLTTGDMIGRFEGHTDWIRGVRFSADGATFVSAAADRCCRTWNVDTGQLQCVTDELPHPLRCVAFHPNGVQFAATGFCCPACIYSVSGGHEVMQLDCAMKDHSAIAFSPDGTRLAVGSGDGQLRIWDVATGKQLQLIAADTQQLAGAGLRADGQAIATGGDGPEVTIWDPATGQKLQHLRTRPAKVFSLKFIDNDQLAVGGSDNRIQIWWRSAPSLVRVLEGHTGTVASLATDAAGRILASGSYDTTIRIWHLDGSATKKTATLPATPTR